MTPEILLISGRSGSGKSTALQCLEDLGYYCVDNLPPPLIVDFLTLCEAAIPDFRRVALVVDIRSRDFLLRFEKMWQQVRALAGKAELLFLDADERILIHRFSETRRPHPLALTGDVVEGIRAEQQRLEPLREAADRVIDTSAFSGRELREFLIQRYGNGADRALNLSITSFAFRNGVLENADLVFDLRFLSNPYYVEHLRPLTGLDKPVRDYIESRPETGQFLRHLEGMLDFLLPAYAREGKTYLTVGFGCTGGRHRSVAVAGIVAKMLKSMGYRIHVGHRELRTGCSDSLGDASQ